MADNLTNVVKEWWPFGAFVLTSLLAFLVGKERQRWRVDQIGIEVERQGQRIDALEKQGQAEAVTLAEIKTTQTLILTAIGELREDLKGKADR